MNANILAQIPGYIFWKDTHLRFLGCNNRFCELTGLGNLRAIGGKTDFDFVWAEYAEYYQEGDRKILDGMTCYNRMEMILKPNGKTVDIFVNKVPLYDHKGQKIGILGSFTEVHNDDIHQYYNLQIKKHHILTPREKEIVGLLIKGKTSKEISSVLRLSFRTVQNYLANIKLKTGAATKSELIEIITNPT